MSLPLTTAGYALGPDDGEALWFNGALGILKATADQTEGRFTAYELRIPKGFAPPLHSHKNEDEFFLILAGEIRLQHGDEVFEGVPGSLAYTPRGIGHSFHVDSEEARLLLLFGPAGVEGSSVTLPRRHAGLGRRRRTSHSRIGIPSWKSCARTGRPSSGHRLARSRRCPGVLTLGDGDTTGRSAVGDTPVALSR